MKPVLVMIPKDATVTKSGDFIFIITPRQRRPRMYANGSIVLSYPNEDSWSGNTVEQVWIDELTNQESGE